MFRVLATAAVVVAVIAFPSALIAGPSGLSSPPMPIACQPGYYLNSFGNCVERPDGNPSGETAVCCDGTHSHSQHRSGTCSGHGGVCQWERFGPGYADNPRREWA
jgi:Protein of unknown function (DUF3761)